MEQNEAQLVLGACQKLQVCERELQNQVLGNVDLVVGVPSGRGSETDKFVKKPIMQIVSRLRRVEAMLLDLTRGKAVIEDEEDTGG